MKENQKKKKNEKSQNDFSIADFDQIVNENIKIDEKFEKIRNLFLLQHQKMIKMEEKVKKAENEKEKSLFDINNCKI